MRIAGALHQRLSGKVCDIYGAVTGVSWGEGIKGGVKLGAH
jgi:hypothetical protein